MYSFIGPKKAKTPRSKGGLSGLGSAALSLAAVYALARDAGFPPEMARRMVAIAKRESEFVPDVIGTIAAGERSYGLWQINMGGSLGPARRAQFGISDDAALLDPRINAMAAYKTWNGSENNLKIAWSIDKDTPYPYRTRYLANLAALPAVELLEAAYLGAGGGETDDEGSGGSGDSGGSGGAGGSDSGSSTSGIVTAVAIGAALAIVWSLAE